MRIVVVDDDQIVALSLKTILEATGKIEVAGIGSSGQEAIVLYEKHRPDVLLMDIRMEGGNGLDAGEKILKQDAAARILYLTTFSDDEYIQKALQIGAKGYILKQDFQGIAAALETVMNGQHVFGDQVVSRLPQMMKAEKNDRFSYEAHDINSRELEIIELVANGLNNKEIAAELFLSEGTVRNYLSEILEKLALRDRTQLAIFYYQNR